MLYARYICSRIITRIILCVNVMRETDSIISHDFFTFSDMPKAPPMITPTAFLVFVLAWINAFKIFKEVYFIAGAYPDYSVYTLQNYMNNMFGKLNYQLVTAAAYSFGLIVFALFGALFFLQRRAARGLN